MYVYMCPFSLQVFSLLVPSSEEDGASYESLNVFPGAYPEGIAGLSFCDENILVTGSKDHQVCRSVHALACGYMCACMHVYLSVSLCTYTLWICAHVAYTIYTHSDFWMALFMKISKAVRHYNWSWATMTASLYPCQKYCFHNLCSIQKLWYICKYVLM